MSRPTTPDTAANGTQSPHTPLTPKITNFALTEYAANTAPEESRRNGHRQKDEASSRTQKENQNPQWEIPDAYLLPNGNPDYLRLILTSRVYEVTEETPLTHAMNLSNRLECRVLLKREDLQPVFSFKLRGAYNKMAHLEERQRWKGVIAVSAGNHAQGVAYSARHLKIPATIVMPSGTPAIKHKNVSRLGGTVRLVGQDFDSAKAEAARLQVEHGLTNIPPFDDPYVIAGQGTIGLELLRQTDMTKLHAIFCCVGGGGLIAGVGVYIKRIAPHVKIIGVETHDANAMVSSLKEGRRVSLADVGLFADGAAVKTVGQETFRVCAEVVDEIIQVSTDEICAAIKDVFEDTRSILEPAGALSLAGLKRYVSENPSPAPQRGMVAIASGANMNFDRLRFVAERAEIGEKKEALLAVTVPERPGSFAELINAIHPAGITEFCYRYNSDNAAHILVGVSITPNNLPPLLEKLKAKGMTPIDLSQSEVAKTHLRYLIGGRPNIHNEHLYSFEFPERPGSLVKFLNELQPGFNISCFHYRNYGGDVAKILAGIQVPTGKEAQLKDWLRKVGYPFEDVNQEVGVELFMKGGNGAGS